MSVKDFFKKFGKKEKEAPKDTAELPKYGDMVEPSMSMFELYVEAWKRYHITANSIDGGHRPTNARQRQFQVQAQHEGEKAMKSFLGDHCQSKPVDEAGKKLWHSAKLEALRRYGR